MLRIKQCWHTECCTGAASYHFEDRWSVKDYDNENNSDRHAPKTYSLQEFGKHFAGRYQTNVGKWYSDHRQWAQILRYILIIIKFILNNN